MIKRVRFKMAGALLTAGSMAIIVAMVVLAAGCAFTHDPRTIRIDKVGSKRFDATVKRIIV